ncbi:MAG: hypothetical protein Q8P41_31545 [Pseudomonadota bacterium]|nr:hypothetical protein [Pseudomonadota bacterium]
MKTYRVTKPFHMAGLDYGPGKIETVTEAELGPYAKDLAACLAESTTPPPVPKPAAFVPPKPAPEPEP